MTTMRPFFEAVPRSIIASIFAILTGCAATPPKTCALGEPILSGYVPEPVYTRHLAIFRANALHLVQIHDTAALQKDLEEWLSTDIRALWLSIEDKRTSQKDRDSAYGMLRLIAIQNEKYPVLQWNRDPEITAIFKAAIENDPQHAALLRRQDWNQPWWVHWVN